MCVYGNYLGVQGYTTVSPTVCSYIQIVYDKVKKKWVNLEADAEVSA